MEVKRVSGIVCYIDDLDVSEDFYSCLGLMVQKQNQQLASSLGSFRIDCIEANLEIRT
jgi:hypothetical protein